MHRRWRRAHLEEGHHDRGQLTAASALQGSKTASVQAPSDRVTASDHPGRGIIGPGLEEGLAFSLLSVG